MKEFTDIAHLKNFVTWMIGQWSEDRRRELFAYFLSHEMEFTPDQAALYVSVALAENAATSADAMEMNARAVQGNWVRMQQQSLASGWLSNKTYSWAFRDDLTYEYKCANYEGYTSPFGQSMSRNSESGERGVWVASDVRAAEDARVLALLPYDSAPRKLQYRWADDAPFYHRACTIGGELYTRQV